MNPKADAESLVNSAIPLAIKMLREHGEFYPYGVILTSEGEIVHYGAKGATDHPKSSEVIALLEESFRARVVEHSMKAFALVFDVLIKPPGKAAKMNAIQVDIEHRDGYATSVYHPYTLQNSVPVFEASFSCQKDLKIFNSPDQDP